MPFKDKAARNQYMREYMRLRRAREPRKRVLNPARALDPSGTVTPLVRIRTGCDILSILERTLGEVMSLHGLAPSETLAKARTIANLAVSALKILEITVLEERVAELEALLHDSGGGKW